MTTYRTFDGDMVDAICAKNYPDVALSQSIDVVLEANPELSSYGPVLPFGVIVELPSIEVVEVVQTIELWS